MAAVVKCHAFASFDGQDPMPCQRESGHHPSTPHDFRYEDDLVLRHGDIIYHGDDDVYHRLSDEAWTGRFLSHDERARLHATLTRAVRAIDIWSQDHDE